MTQAVLSRTPRAAASIFVQSANGSNKQVSAFLAALSETRLPTKVFRVFCYLYQRSLPSVSGELCTSIPQKEIAEACLRPEYPDSNDGVLRRMVEQTISFLEDCHMLRVERSRGKGLITRANSYFILPPDGWREATISHPVIHKKRRLNRDNDPGRISDGMDVSSINDPGGISSDPGRISDGMDVSSRQRRSPDDQRRSSQDQPIYGLNNSNQEFKPLKSSDPRKDRKRETEKTSQAEKGGSEEQANWIASPPLTPENYQSFDWAAFQPSSHLAFFAHTHAEMIKAQAARREKSKHNPSVQLIDDPYGLALYRIRMNGTAGYERFLGLMQQGSSTPSDFMTWFEKARTQGIAVVGHTQASGEWFVFAIDGKAIAWAGLKGLSWEQVAQRFQHCGCTASTSNRLTIN